MNEGQGPNVQPRADSSNNVTTSNREKSYCEHTPRLWTREEKATLKDLMNGLLDSPKSER